ncbi:MAG: SDR family NAD(P)-dependent oxidoreductase [Spirochaetales bacterium]|nr:SDR family NAD(P)-dependent oxidoreductase [Spirochaetales bacterium]
MYNLVVVAGGTSGIGFAFSKEIAKSTKHLVLIGRDESKFLSKKSQITEKSPSIILDFFECDIIDEELCRSTLKKIHEKYGNLDLLVNSAGIARPNYFDKIAYPSFDYTVKTNLYGTRNINLAAIPYFNIRGGQIINISSVAGVIGIFGYTDYAASKFAIIGFSEVLRQELMSQKIDVKVLCPPDTYTEGFIVENTTKPFQTIALSKSAKVLSADYVAHKLLRSLKKNSFLIIVGFESRFMYWFKRNFPRSFEKLVISKIKKAEKKQRKSIKKREA